MEKPRCANLAENMSEALGNLATAEMLEIATLNFNLTGV